MEIEQAMVGAGTVSQHTTPIDQDIGQTSPEIDLYKSLQEILDDDIMTGLLEPMTMSQK